MNKHSHIWLQSGSKKEYAWLAHRPRPAQNEISLRHAWFGAESMMTIPSIKPTHKAVQAYYDALGAYSGQGVQHETAVRSAFQNLLAETGKVQKWTLIPELTMKVKGKTIRPDGTMRDDEWLFPRGYWEAKDTSDDLDVEIRKKIAKGYPTLNTIFEDIQAGVLYQNGREVFRTTLAGALME
jgi:hypothetical protein